MTSLFRIEVLEAQNDQGYGETLHIRPLRFATYTIAAVVIVVVITIYLSLSSFTRKHTVQGLLQPSGGNITISASQGGIAANVFVAEGDEVEAGQQLLQLRRGEWLESGSEAFLFHYEELKKQKEWLIERIDNTDAIFTMERTNLELEAKTVDASVEKLIKQIDIQKKQVANLKKSLRSKGNLLTKGLLSQEEYIGHQNQYLATTERLNDIKFELTSREIEQESLANRLKNLSLTQAENLITLKEQLSSKEQQIIDSQVRQQSIIRAPVSGRGMT